MEINILAGAAYSVLQPILGIAVVALGGLVVSEMRKRGFKATYATALVRAMGSGVMAAQHAGVDPFSKEGLRMVGKIGAEYLQSTIPDTSQALDIDMDGHVERVTAQLGTVLATARAAAPATPTLSQPVSQDEIARALARDAVRGITPRGAVPSVFK